MKTRPSSSLYAAVKLAIPALVIATIFLIILQSSTLWAQYAVKNDRILAPEVTHFTRPTDPGVDAHGDIIESQPDVYSVNMNGKFCPSAFHDQGNKSISSIRSSPE